MDFFHDRAYIYFFCLVIRWILVGIILDTVICNGNQLIFSYHFLLSLKIVGLAMVVISFTKLGRVEMKKKKFELLDCK